MNHKGATNGRSLSEGNPQKIRVLMYHRIVDAIGLSIGYPRQCLHVNEFRRHLTFLERWGFTAITFEDYRLFQAGELNLPKKPVILTFDDGYQDTYELAFPVLREFGMRAVVFVVGDRGLKESVWDQPAILPTAPLMTGEQILELHRAGFEIGSHSLTHERLPSLSREKAWEEISRSRELLEILLNAPVLSFAFPYGESNETTKKMLLDAGYTIGCATYTGPPTFGSDPFEIRRTLVPSATETFGMGVRTLLPFGYYSWLRWKAKVVFTNARMMASGDGEVEAEPVLEGVNLAEKS